MSSQWCKAATQAYVLPLVFEGAILLSGVVLWNLRAPYEELSQRFLRMQKLRTRYRSRQPAPRAAGVLERTWWSGNYFITVGFDDETCSGIVPENAVMRLAPVAPELRVAA